MSRPAARVPLPIRGGKPMRRPVGPSGSSTPGLLAPGVSGRAGTSAKSAEEGFLYVAGVKDNSKRVSEFRSETDICPVCHTDRQFNKNLRLLVSPCYHKMCESCIDRLFTLGPEPCPQCGKILRKVNFAHQTFEDLKVEKEVAVRRRMAEYFNKRQEDFALMREYDDYLQEVEDLTFNLLNDIDVPATEKRIAEFRKQNAQIITTNAQRAALELLSQAEKDDIERRAREERMRMVEEAERTEAMEEERSRAEIVQALASGSRETAEAIRSRAAKAKAARAEALAAAVPPSLAALYASMIPDTTDDDVSPLSAAYKGPYVPMPYSDVDAAPWKAWYALADDYVDGRTGVAHIRDDRDGRVRGGGYDLGLFWEMEIRSAVESLGVEPLRGGGVLVA